MFLNFAYHQYDVHINAPINILGGGGGGENTISLKNIFLKAIF